MNETTLLREAGPEGPSLSVSARQTARAALLDEIKTTGTGRLRRLRRPSRKAVWRTGAAVATAAAAWATVVVIAAPDGPGSPAANVTLVDFQMPTFPLSLEPEPEGLSPAFDGDGDGSSIAAYDDGTGENGFTIFVGEEEPDLGERNQFSETEPPEDVRFGDRDARLVQGSYGVACEDGLSICGTRHFTQLAWEFRDDLWVLLEGDGLYRDPQRLLGVAESLVDRPQPATLSVGLAPQGWSIAGYKMGRILTLVNDAYPQQSLTVHIPLPEDVIPADQLLDQLMAPVGPVIPVTVHGRPAQLVRTDQDAGMPGWFLQAQFADGTMFTVQAPDAFTRAQVIELAEQVTHDP